MERNENPARISRRRILTGTGVTAASMLATGFAANAEVKEPASPLTKGSASDDPIAARVSATPFVDTHEHLVEEETRIERRKTPLIPCPDWATLFYQYLSSDFVAGGMPKADLERVLKPGVDAAEKWRLLEPYWNAVKNTGYAQVVRKAANALYDIDDINAKTIPALAEGYDKLIKPGFYKKILCEVAGIESCQVNSLEKTFMESRQPALLMQDISILNFGIYGGQLQKVAETAGVKVKDLADQHSVIDWWFKTYGQYAVAVKSQVAYSRRLDFEDVPAEQAEAGFKRILNGDSVDESERKKVDDHIFWYCVRKATELGLPVKLHTGTYAGNNGMPLARVMMNPADVCELLRRSPDTTFVLMHIGYPYQDQMVAIAKNYTNAVIDMCWAWIINPVASARFLSEFLVTAPANKVLTFGGDYILAECTVGHAVIARHGIIEALNSVVKSGWISQNDALDLVEPIMCGNARRIFKTAEKAKALEQAPWIK